MSSTASKHPITSGSVVEELRRLAEQAEASGDRITAVRALRVAWLIEHRPPTHPVSPSPERILRTLEKILPLVVRFTPDHTAKVEACILELRLCLVELAEAERQIYTVH